MTDDHPPPVSRAAASSAGMGTPRRLVFGLVALGAAMAGMVQAGGAASGPERTAVVRGDVSSTGALSAPAGWRAVHLDTGRYRLAGPAEEADVDVSMWHAAADVTIVPLGDGATEVRFQQGGLPLDTDFTFVALVRG